MGTLSELVDGVRRRFELEPPDEGRLMSLATLIVLPLMAAATA